jgi:hypothetical protein
MASGSRPWIAELGKIDMEVLKLTLNCRGQGNGLLVRLSGDINEDDESTSKSNNENRKVALLEVAVE